MTNRGLQIRVSSVDTALAAVRIDREIYDQKKQQANQLIWCIKHASEIMDEACAHWQEVAPKGTVVIIGSDWHRLYFKFNDADCQEVVIGMRPLGKYGPYRLAAIGIFSPELVPLGEGMICEITGTNISRLAAS